MGKWIIGTVVAMIVAIPAAAETHEIKMRTTLQSEGTMELMVFDPPFIKAEVGDTIRFVPTDPGHSVQSSFVPEGGPTWNSAMDETIEVVVDTEGVYLYRCEPHLYLGMVGVIQVGEPVNFEAASDAAVELMANVTTNNDRYTRYLLLVER